MKFSELMWLMIKLQVTKTQGFPPSLKKTFLEKPHREIKLPPPPPPSLGVLELICNSQASLSISSFTELSDTPFFFQWVSLSYISSGYDTLCISLKKIIRLKDYGRPIYMKDSTWFALLSYKKQTCSRRSMIL